MPNLIQVNNLSKKYPKRDKLAVNDVSFKVSEGEIIALVGHNGAGKSSLFDMIGGLSKATSGSTTVTVDPSDIGWCPQREIIDWSLTVRQNISLGYELRNRKSKKVLNLMIEELAVHLGLTQYLDRTAETLSGGELRRTQIGRALVGNPKVMILDEPTTGLDPNGIEVVFNYLESQREAGCSAIISTHETSRFSSHCTRVIAMNEGTLIADLPVKEFLSLSPGGSDDLWDSYKHLIGDPS